MGYNRLMANTNGNSEMRYYPEGFFDGPSSRHVVLGTSYADEIWALNQALDRGFVTNSELDDPVVEDRVIAMMGMRNGMRSTYFVEMPHEWVLPQERGKRMMEMFREEVELPDGRRIELADYLLETNSAVSIALSTLDQPTAEVVRYLNDKEVPVVGWVVLGDGEGYWTNASSVEASQQKVVAIDEWLEEYNLDIVTLGFDLELPLSLVASVSQRQVVDAIKAWFEYRGSIKGNRLEGTDPQTRFEMILKATQNMGYRQEFYTFPRRFRWLMNPGVTPPVGAREIEMVYSSDLPVMPLGLGVDALLSPGAIPAIGIINGVEGQTPGRDFGRLLYPSDPNASRPINHLGPDEILRDIRALMGKRVDFAANHCTLGELYVFALNAPKVAFMVNDALDEAFKELL